MQQTVDAAYIFYYATNAAGALSQQPTTSSDVPAASWSSESPAERVQLKKRLTGVMNDCCIIAKNVSSCFHILLAFTKLTKIHLIAGQL